MLMKVLAPDSAGIFRFYYVDWQFFYLMFMEFMKEAVNPIKWKREDDAK